MNPVIMSTLLICCLKYQKGLKIEMQSMMNWSYMMRLIYPHYL